MIKIYGKFLSGLMLAMSFGIAEPSLAAVVGATFRRVPGRTVRGLVTDSSWISPMDKARWSKPGRVRSGPGHGRTRSTSLDQQESRSAGPTPRFGATSVLRRMRMSNSPWRRTTAIWCLHSAFGEAWTTTVRTGTPTSKIKFLSG